MRNIFNARDLKRPFHLHAGMAFLPYALYVLLAAPFSEALGTALAATLVTAVPLLVTDRLFYGRWTVRVRPVRRPLSVRHILLENYPLSLPSCKSISEVFQACDDISHCQ